MYCAVVALSNTVSVPSVTVVESLVQVTVVAGPPVEIQVRVNGGLGPLCNVSIDIEIFPVKKTFRTLCQNNEKYRTI